MRVPFSGKAYRSHLHLLARHQVAQKLDHPLILILSGTIVRLGRLNTVPTQPSVVSNLVWISAIDDFGVGIIDNLAEDILKPSKTSLPWAVTIWKQMDWIECRIYLETIHETRSQDQRAGTPSETPHFFARRCPSPAPWSAGKSWDGMASVLGAGQASC